MNIAINIAITGGIGGIERNLFTFVEAMRAHSIDIYTMQFIPRGFVPSGNNVTIRWFEKKGDTLHINLENNKDYDLFFYYAACGPIYVGDYLKAKKRIVIPNGNNVREIEKYFDYVICQAEDGIKYFDDMQKKISITPCVIIPVNKIEPIQNLPQHFFLTVFNPYTLDSQYDDGVKPAKGFDLIYELADDIALPLIWCHSDVSLPIRQNILEHPNIIHLSDISQEKLYYLYTHATAYISFSRQESFGWSIADAIMFDKPIISRNTGVISSLSPKQKGLYIYHNTEELRELLKRGSFENGDYNKDIFSPEIFEKKIMAIAE